MKRLAVCVILVLSSILAARAEAQPSPPANPDEIVVTAQRSGIPVWRVRGNAGTLVLIGTIEEVAKGTNWNPGGLAAALRQADQVMFPQGAQLTGGFFSILRAQSKAKRMERMPAGQSLVTYLRADQYRRLLQLQNKGLLKPGFEARRPLFVAYDLTEAGKGGEPSGHFLSISRVDWKADPEGFVRHAINQYHLKLVPMRKVSLNGALDRLASTPPSVHVPCLIAAADFAEAGPATFRARSQAWVTRRVAEVVNSPAEKAFATCASIVRGVDDTDAIEASLQGVLRQPVTTVAVLELSTLAAPGQVLDRLAAAGFEIRGPKWK